MGIALLFQIEVWNSVFAWCGIRNKTWNSRTKHGIACYSTLLLPNARDSLLVFHIFVYSISLFHVAIPDRKRIPDSQNRVFFQQNRVFFHIIQGRGGGCIHQGRQPLHDWLLPDQWVLSYVAACTWAQRMCLRPIGGERASSPHPWGRNGILTEIGLDDME